MVCVVDALSDGDEIIDQSTIQIKDDGVYKIMRIRFLALYLPSTNRLGRMVEQMGHSLA